ncbi:MAG: ArsR/SmtB family transcription factor [Solirubrobacteraceae bacterium]
MTNGDSVRRTIDAGPERALHRDALDALGDENRRAIVEILSHGGQSVQQIADQLPISRPAVSRHLRLLKGAGLVIDQTNGTRHIYELRDDGVEAIRRYFADVWDQAIVRFGIVARNTTPAAQPRDDRGRSHAMPPRDDAKR